MKNRFDWRRIIIIENKQYVQNYNNQWVHMDVAEKPAQT